MVDLLGEKVAERAPRGAIPRWCDLYGYSPRGIKNWIALGRDVGEMPPLDNPAEFEKWAEKHLGKLTSKLEEGIAKAKRELGEVVEEKEAEAPVEPIEMPDVTDAEMGMEQQLQHYRREFVMIQKLRHAALESGDLSRSKQLFEQGKEVSGEIRQLEKILPTALEQAGVYQRTSEIRREVGKMLGFLRRSLLTRGARCGARLRSAKTDAETSNVWREEVEEIFRECVAAEFRES